MAVRSKSIYKTEPIWGSDKAQFLQYYELFKDTDATGKWFTESSQKPSNDFFLFSFRQYLAFTNCLMSYLAVPWCPLFHSFHHAPLCHLPGSLHCNKKANPGQPVQFMGYNNHQNHRGLAHFNRYVRPGVLKRNTEAFYVQNNRWNVGKMENLAKYYRLDNHNTQAGWSPPLGSYIATS